MARKGSKSHKSGRVVPDSDLESGGVPATRGAHSVTEHPEITVSWSNLGLSVATKAGPKTILSELAGIVRPGELLAIMGPSGSGKSTTLNVLANRIRNYDGEVRFNGQPYAESMRRHASYVMQDDALLGSLTVRENIAYSAEFSLPSTVSAEEKRARVDQVIADLGLTRVQHSKVGNILIRGVSGGERRRTSIATELVASPSVLFLDEPTSGLDASSAYHVMKSIRDIARAQRRAVIAVIHQPSMAVFSLFDKVMFVSRGECAFFGPTAELPDFLESLDVDVPAHENVCDFMMDQINDDFVVDAPGSDAADASGSGSGSTETETETETETSGSSSTETTGTSSEGSGSAGSGSEQVESHSGSSEGSGDNARPARVLNVIRGYAASEWNERTRTEVTDALDTPVEFEATGIKNCLGREAQYARSLPFQIWTLFTRAMLNAVRYVALYWVRVAMYIMLALLMGSVWYDQDNSNQFEIQDRLSVHFFSIAFLAFMSVAAIPAYIEDRVIFERERANGKYSTLAYLTTNTLVSAVFVFIISLSFSSIVYFMIKLNTDDAGNRFFRFVLFLYLCLLVAESLMVLLSAAIPYFIIALALGAGANGFFMVVQGYFIRKKAIPVWWRYWAHYLSYQKYGFESLVVNDFTGRVFNCAPIANSTSCFCLFKPVDPLACSFRGEDVLREFEYEDVDLWSWMGVLIAMTVALRVATYIVMRLKKVRY